MEDTLQEHSTFDLASFQGMDNNSSGSYSYRSKRLPSNVQDYNHHAAMDSIDLVGRELNELHEKLLKMSVRAHMLEVDLATQFNPETLLEIRQVDTKCQECVEVTEKIKVQVEEHTEKIKEV